VRTRVHDDARRGGEVRAVVCRERSVDDDRSGSDCRATLPRKHHPLVDDETAGVRAGRAPTQLHGAAVSAEAART
jgi:hypothetical protein